MVLRTTNCLHILLWHPYLIFGTITGIFFDGPAFTVDYSHKFNKKMRFYFDRTKQKVLFKPLNNRAVILAADWGGGGGVGRLAPTVPLHPSVGLRGRCCHSPPYHVHYTTQYQYSMVTDVWVTRHSPTGHFPHNSPRHSHVGSLPWHKISLLTPHFNVTRFCYLFCLICSRIHRVGLRLKNGLLSHKFRKKAVFKASDRIIRIFTLYIPIQSTNDIVSHCLGLIQPFTCKWLAYSRCPEIFYPYVELRP